MQEKEQQQKQQQKPKTEEKKKKRLTVEDVISKLNQGVRRPLNISEDLILSLARPFQPVSNYTWCVEKKDINRQRRGPAMGLLYVKVPKTASSTISGVAERIARKFMNGTKGKCSVSDGHEDRKHYKDRIRNKSFMFGSIRDPTSRAISRVFFNIKKERDISMKEILNNLQTDNNQFGCVSKGQGGFQVNYMSMNDIPINSALILQNTSSTEISMDLNYTNIHLTIETILQDYDFIILNERIDESLVIMQLLLGLDPKDMLYLSSKVSGGYVFDINKEQCRKMQKKIVPQNISKYLSSNSWLQHIYGDSLLVNVVNKSLDLTIDHIIGPVAFQKAYEEYKELKYKAEEACSSRAIFPCSIDGTYQIKSKLDCYRKDWGCGYPCLDEFVRNKSVESRSF